MQKQSECCSVTGTCTATVAGDVKDLGLAAEGKRRILWADRDMPVLARVRERFERERPLEGIRLSACLHVTAETANLMRTFKAGGADAVLCASNPLSTQDDVAASLVKDFGIPTYAIRGADNKTYYKHIRASLEHAPQITLDDGADLVTTVLKDYPGLHDKIIASMEETTTGVIRLRAMERDGALRFPVVAVNDAMTKYLFDNRYGTGQSTLDGIIRATDILIAGKNIVCAGYGWCGKGFSSRARGLGAKVIVTEINPIRALEASLDGFQVMPMIEAVKVADLVVTITGNRDVLRREHFEAMRDGCMVANSGHFNVEIDIPALESLAEAVHRGVRNHVDEFVLADDRRVYLLAEGRLINLAAAEGHPASVMDMSFATQALATEFGVKNRGKLPVKVVDVPAEIEDEVSVLKLESMEISIDQLTPEQERYLASWEEGT